VVREVEHPLGIGGSEVDPHEKMLGGKRLGDQIARELGVGGRLLIDGKRALACTTPVSAAEG
jgi:hypothetical protein